MELRHVVRLTLLLAAAAASWVLLDNSGRDARPEPEESVHLGVGYYATRAKLSGTGENGRLLYRVDAATVVQSPGDDTVDLHEVAISYEPTDRRPWSLHADTGEIRADGTIIELSGNVVAETRSGDVTSATIHTDRLEFFTATDTATTDSVVTIDFAGGAVRGTGMRARLADNHLELLSAVRGTYAP